jgi:sugar-specific transcriptional regulator TrmB
LETQQAATLKALAVEERLTRIEQQIQRQNASYEARIEKLTRELMVAKEESRELIRARISQVKAEMEAARARLMAQSEAGGDGSP